MIREPEGQEEAYKKNTTEENPNHGRDERERSEEVEARKTQRRYERPANGRRRAPSEVETE